ncbi:MAG: bacteriohemerythrin [Spirochaetaceae bacterium]
MEWKKEYETGIEEIDNQHKTIITIINKYNKTIADKSINSFKEIGTVLVYLINYTSFHFDAEESYMEKINYPGLHNQKELHKNLIQKLREILVKIKNKESYTPIEFYYFLMSWLNNHILGEDMNIGKYSRENQQKTTMQKINLDNPSKVLDIVVPNLKRITVLQQNGSISEEDCTLRRIIFLKDYYNNFEKENSKLLYNIVKSILLILEKNIITNNEKKLLVDFLKINELHSKFEYTDEDNIIINQILN